MYKCNTYKGEMQQFLRRQNTERLMDTVYNYVNEELIRRMCIKLLSDEKAFTLSELEELFAED